MPTPQPGTPAPGPTPLALLQAAFRDLHRARLYGFALLLTLGDRALAADATDRAIAEASGDVTAHRYPERAAAWLRSRVVRRLGRRRPSVSPGTYQQLEPMGLGPGAVAGLAALSLRQRAAIIVVDVEGFDDEDAATAVALRPPGLRSLVRRARVRYLDAASGVDEANGLPDGPVIQRVRAAAERALQ
jgi:hypothetical protein